MLEEAVWKQLAIATQLAEFSHYNLPVSTSPSYICHICKKEENVLPSAVDEEIIEVLSLHSSVYQPSTIDIFFRPCCHCGAYISLHYNGSWLTVDDVLCLKGDDMITIRMVDTASDYLAVLILSQVLYNQRDIGGCGDGGESPFVPPSPDHALKIAIMKGTAVGFYSLIARGSKLTPYAHYELDILDTIYVRTEFRRIGLATRLILDALATVQPSSLLGFSEPVSTSLLRVMWKLLEAQPELRDRLWACSHNGGLGYRWNIYLGVLAQKLTALPTACSSCTA